VVLPGVGGLPEEYIVEQWLEGEETDRTGAFGPYVSVEAMAQEGRVTPLAITGKFPTAPICRETGNFMPHHLDPDLAGRVLALAVDAASALGVRSGALHIEIKLTPSGPRIIEVNGRVGGGGIDDLYRAHRGQSLADIAVRIAMGERLELRPAVLEARGPVVYDYYLQPPMSASRVVRLDGLDRVDGLEGVEGTTVNRTVGDRVDWRVGSQGYVLSVRGRAADHAGVAQAPGLIDATLDITYASE
jgi:biotin carboxylase